MVVIGCAAPDERNVLLRVECVRAPDGNTDGHRAADNGRGVGGLGRVIGLEGIAIAVRGLQRVLPTPLVIRVVATGEALRLGQRGRTGQAGLDLSNTHLTRAGLIYLTIAPADVHGG